MKISLKGYGENTATFRINTEIKAGEPVYMEENFTVMPCTENSDFIGAAVNSRDGYACVQLGGYVRFPYTGSNPDVGLCNLVADGNGGVRVQEYGRQFVVTDVDPDSKTVGIIL